MKDHRLIDERSLAFGQLTAMKVLADPSLVEKARANIARWLQTCSPQVCPVLLQWRSILDGPLEGVLAQLSATDEEAVRLRQSSPFAGVMSNAERTAIIREFANRDSKST